MQLTGLGMVLLPLGAVTFLFLPRAIYYLAIFFVPFTASSLLNLETGIPLTPGQYFGGLFIFQVILITLYRGRLSNLWLREKTMIWLLIFLLAVLASVILPYLTIGGSRVSVEGVPDITMYPVFDSFKGTLVVIFGVVFLFCVVTRNKTELALKKTLQVYLASGVFVCLWGFLEFACDNYLDIEYPAFIFNNAALPSMQGYDQIVFIDGIPFSRIASVAHEPSIYAKILITMVPILTASVLMKTPILGWIRDRVALALIIGTLVVTTAATAYIGLVVSLGLMTVMLFLLNRRIRPPFLLTKLVFIPAFLLGILLVISPFVRTMFYWTVFDKLSSGSAIQRSGFILDASKVFEIYPFFGAGWGTVTSHDLVIYLLANAGITSLFSFSLVIGLVGIKCIRTINLSNRSWQSRSRLQFTLVAGLLVSLASLLTVGLVTGLEFYLEHFYLILALVISVNLIAHKGAGITILSPDVHWRCDERVSE